MKNKIVALAIALVLLSGIFVTAIQLVPYAKADVEYHLDVYSDPALVPVANGTGDYTDGTYVELDAIDEYIVGDTKYVFDYWDIDGAGSYGDPLQWVYMDQDRNATAHYKTQHKFTVIYPWSATWLQQFVPYIWSENATGFVAGSGANGTYWAWIPEDTFVLAGLSRSDFALWLGVPYVKGDHNEERVLFVNWTGLGFYMSGGYAWSNPGQIKMTGPMTASAAWKYMFKLTVTSDQLPKPSGQGWYSDGTIKTLTANPIVVNWAREYRLEHWEVDGVSQGTGVNPINVTMDSNHTASAFYTCWVFVYLDDDISNQSGIKDAGNWYEEGVPYTFTAPDPVNIDSSHRYGFKRWIKFGSGWLNTSNPVTVIFDATWAGYTLKAIYHMQYHMILTSSGSTVPGYLYPDSDDTGWYDAGSTVNLKAKPVVDMSSTMRYKFVQWKNHLGGTNPNNNITFAIMQPWNLTAEYDLEWLLTWSHEPTSISVAGSPGQLWKANGTDLWYGLPATDVTGQYQFYYWTINSVTYPQGQNTVHVGLVTGPVSGVATYANMTRVFMDPSYHSETSHAFCNEFDVTVYAANFDAARIVSGEPMDIYGFDIGILFDQTLLELKTVTLHLDDFWSTSYFVAINNIDNSAGTYELAATVRGNHTGFEGTRAMFTMTFHVIYDSCYPYDKWTWIQFDPAQRQLANSLGHSIGPELGWGPDCKYELKTVKPIVEVIPALTTIRLNDPTQFFDVDIYLNHGSKIYGFYVQVQFDATLLDVDNVAIATYLKPTFSQYSWWKSGGNVYVKVIQDLSVPLQNCSGLLFTIRFKVIKQIYYTTGGPNSLSCNIDIVFAKLYVSCEIGRWIQDYPGDNLDGMYVYSPLPGDLNYDGTVDVLDLQLVADAMHKLPAKYDVVTNGKTDLYDLVFVALRFGDHI